MKTGIISTYDTDRGFGFIKELGTPRLTHWFFHINSCLCEPIKGLQVQFNVGDGRKGPAAIDVAEINAGINALARVRS